MAELVVITGPPGAGKSTMARAIADKFEPSVLVEGDRFFGFLNRGAILPWLEGADRQNGVVLDAAAAATGHFVRGDYTTVYDGVIGAWRLPEFCAVARVNSLHYLVLLPPTDTCAERIASRSNHGFKDEPAMLKMHRSFTDAEIDQRHVLTDVADGVEKVVAAALALMKKGALLYTPAHPPRE